MAKRRPKPDTKAAQVLAFEQLSQEEQDKLDELCREAIAFRRSHYDFDQLVIKAFDGGMPRDLARTRCTQLREEIRPRRDRVQEKEDQKERLMESIRKAKAAGNWNAVSKLEATYADVVGTREPIQVEAVVSGAMSAVIAQLTPEKYAEIVERQRRKNELARMAEEKLLPPKAG